MVSKRVSKKGWMLNGVSRPYATNFVRKVQFKHQSMYHQELKVSGKILIENWFVKFVRNHKRHCLDLPRNSKVTISEPQLSAVPLNLINS